LKGHRENVTVWPMNATWNKLASLLKVALPELVRRDVGKTARKDFAAQESRVD